MRFKTTVSVLLFTGLMAGCSPTEAPSGQDRATEMQQFESQAGKISIPKELSRITVLDTNSLNTIQTLGASDKVVALPQGTPLPTALQQFNSQAYINVGTAKEPNLEKIAESRPQLILMSGRMENLMAQIQGIAPVYFNQVDYTDRLNSFRQHTLNIADMVGKRAEAEQQLTTLSKDIKALQEKTKDKTALMILVNNNKLSAYGVGSRFGLIHDLYGFQPADPNIKVGTHGMSVSHEFIAEKNPDYLFVIDRSAAITEGDGGARKVLDNNLVRQTKAAKNGHIVFLDSSTWYLINDSLGGMQSALNEVDEVVK